MRDIKFRAWDNKQKEIHYWEELKCISISVAYLFNNTDLNLMQYTGLKDKNGVEIYEGDIVRDLRSPFKDIRSHNRVFYQEDRGRFVFDGWEIPAGMSHTFEVIGNIYENPELLENEKKGLK